MVLTFVVFSINSCVTGIFQVVCLKKGQKINLNDEPCDAKHIYQNASEKGGNGKTNSMAVCPVRGPLCVLNLFLKNVSARHWRKAVFTLTTLTCAVMDHKDHTDVVSSSLRPADRAVTSFTAWELFPQLRTAPQA